MTAVSRTSTGRLSLCMGLCGGFSSKIDGLALYWHVNNFPCVCFSLSVFV